MSDNNVISPPSPASETGSETSAIVHVATPSWQQQDEILRGLWMQNKSPQEISDVLGRSIAAIMTRAARLGLPRRAAPGRKPGSRIALQNGEIHASTPRPAQRTSEPSKETKTTSRVCLMCLRIFPSQGRHNRICASCKNSAEYESAICLSDINLPI
ncbi:MAG: hypothetical protein PHW76_00280 [Alphaproteobacteria bacterium]|nr:hypothetical protein [Alphaproteobacteria bacterium]